MPYSFKKIFVKATLLFVVFRQKLLPPNKSSSLMSFTKLQTQANIKHNYYLCILSKWDRLRPCTIYRKCIWIGSFAIKFWSHFGGATIPTVILMFYKITQSNCFKHYWKRCIVPEGFLANGSSSDKVWSVTWDCAAKSIRAWLFELDAAKSYKNM